MFFSNTGGRTEVNAVMHEKTHTRCCSLQTSTSNPYSQGNNARIVYAFFFWVVMRNTYQFAGSTLGIPTCRKLLCINTKRFNFGSKAHIQFLIIVDWLSCGLKPREKDSLESEPESSIMTGFRTGIWTESTFCTRRLNHRAEWRFLCRSAAMPVTDRKFLKEHEISQGTPRTCTRCSSRNFYVPGGGPDQLDCCKEVQQAQCWRAPQNAVSFESFPSTTNPTWGDIFEYSFKDQRSKLKSRTSLFTETWQKRCSSFEFWSFENDTPSGIVCTIQWGFYHCEVAHESRSEKIATVNNHPQASEGRQLYLEARGFIRDNALCWRTSSVCLWVAERARTPFRTPWACTRRPGSDPICIPVRILEKAYVKKDVSFWTRNSG